MSQTNLQFSVASHVMTALADRHGEPIRSAELAGSVNADPSFVRRVLAKLSRAGLVATSQGRNGACILARPPRQITLLDIYRASGAPAAFAIHRYPEDSRCTISCNIKHCLEDVLAEAQAGLEQSLKKQTLAGLVTKARRKPRGVLAHG
jgi:Rrf2 family protein